MAPLRTTNRDQRPAFQSPFVLSFSFLRSSESPIVVGFQDAAEDEPWNAADLSVGIAVAETDLDPTPRRAFKGFVSPKKLTRDY